MQRAGQKTRLLYLQKPTRAISSTTGAPTETWTNVSYVFAEVMPQSGSETVESGQNSARVAHKIRINYRPDVTTERRFLIDGFPGQLNGALNDSTTSVLVDDSAFALFAQANRERALLVDSEFMLISSITGNTITVTRAQYGTSAAAHADNARVTLYRQLNIESVYDVDGRKANLICECVEIT